jgi:hypothetical protein
MTLKRRFFTMKRKILFSIIALGFTLANGDALLLNEYNAVASDQQLKNNGYDTHFGDIDGNGGSWIELVVNEDYLDIRGATLNIEKSGGVHVLTANFPNLLQFAYLRKGTIITISNEPTDLSYTPLDSNNPDWTINLNANDLINRDGTFDISDRTMDISIMGVDETPLMRNSGEVIKGWGIDNKEVFKLKKEPSSSIEPTDTAYGDDYSGKQVLSTFGSPNRWIETNDTTSMQTFSALRDISLEGSINQMLLLNEYNAVKHNKKLKDKGTDTYFGRIKGNGGSWLELVILKDKVDLRGAIIKIVDKDSNIYRGKLPNLDVLSQVRSGTILTISEVATNLSYNPFDTCNSDWTLNINKDDLTPLEGSFFTNHKNLVVSMVSGSGDVTIMPESGEGIVGKGVGRREMYKLKRDPSNSVTPTDSTYGDDFNGKGRSTFGSPNHWKHGDENLTTQNFDELRVVALKEHFRQAKSSLLLNEYNGVASDKLLKGDGEDLYFGITQGNGGSWLELVVTRDYLNLQDANLTIKENCSESFRGTFPPLLELAYLRKGTIITVSNEPTDVTYSPFAPHAPDWKMNININDFSNRVGNFNTSSQDLIVSISSGGEALLSESGEGVWGEHLVDNQEVYKLKAEPNKNVTPYDNTYGDDNNSEVLSTFFNANRWYDGDSCLKYQNFTLREDLDLTEVGGIVLSNIVGLEELRDAESLQYVPVNNTLWITDDDSHHVYEMDFATHEIKTVFDDVDLGTFTNGAIQDHCENHLGACDIESVAYNENSDTLYILTGHAPGDPVIFKLTRPDTNSSFTLSDYRKLGDTEYPATTFINSDFIVASVNSLYTYDFDTNQTSTTPLYTTPAGKIVGLAYDKNSSILWITTSNFELLKVDWITKETKSVYAMRDNGVYDPRGIEIIDGKLHILEGINHKAKADEAIAPIGHPLKNAIHIYETP